MRKHFHGPKKRLPVHVGVRLINWKRRENICGLLDAADTNVFRKENANEHWKTVVNGLIAKPKSPCVESGHVYKGSASPSVAFAAARGRGIF